MYYSFVVPAGIASFVCIVCTFALGVSMRPVRKRYKVDLLPFHRLFAYAALSFAILHVLFQKL